MRYRPEIDGVRALAVVPVILFHAGVPGFGGGFVGVDVFFVISGYLITTLLIADLAEGRFSLLQFYERRARRLLPALIVVMAACIPFAWAWMTPRDLVDFTQSLAAVASFSSNILFWRESGYFDTATELKPLLHTWSLAVEEQYYILFPLFLMLLWPARRGWIVPALGLMALISFGVAYWGVQQAPAAAFYLLPTRGWELLAGALAAMYLRRSVGGPAGPALRETGAGLGVALIVYAVVAYDRHMAFPGPAALIPVLGTVLIVLCARTDTATGRLLSLPPLVGIGLISYSAYLWHQPLFAFARYRSMSELSPVTIAALCGLTLLLAWLSWRYVETPIRRGAGLSRRQVLATSAALLGGIALGGMWSLSGNGFADRLASPQKQLLQFETYPRQVSYREGSCFLLPDQSPGDFADGCGIPRALLLWGDSHAAAMYYGLSRAHAVSQFNASACPPLLDIEIPGQPHCQDINRFVIGFVGRARPHTLILHATWPRYEADTLQVGLRRTINAIRAQSPGTRIVLVGGAPYWGQRGLPNLAMRLWTAGADDFALRPGARLPAELHEVETRDALLRGVARQAGPAVAFVSLLEALCEQGKCLAFVDEDGQVAPTAWDYGHLTRGGSLVASAAVVEAITR